MEWTTVVLIAIGAAAFLVVLAIVVSLIIAYQGRRWFERQKEEMDREHEEWKRRHGFDSGQGPRR